MCSGNSSSFHAFFRIISIVFEKIKKYFDIWPFWIFFSWILNLKMGVKMHLAVWFAVFHKNRNLNFLRSLWCWVQNYFEIKFLEKIENKFFLMLFWEFRPMVSWFELWAYGVLKGRQRLRIIFFLKNLLLQSDVVFDSDLNNCNFHSLAPPDDEKKNIFDFFNFFFDFFFNLFFGFLQLIFSAWGRVSSPLSRN